VNLQLAPGVSRFLPDDASPSTLVGFAFDVCAMAARDVDAAAECIQGADFDQLIDAAQLARTADRLHESAAQLRARSDYLKQRAMADATRDYDNSLPHHVSVAQFAGAVVGLAALQVQEAEKTLREWARAAIARTASLTRALPPGDLTESRREHVEQFERPTTIVDVDAALRACDDARTPEDAVAAVDAVRSSIDRLR